MENPIVIIGNGCAAVECFLSLRRNGYAGEIHVFSEGELPAYNPMLTSYYASGRIAYPQMFPYGDSETIYAAHGVTLHRNAKVSALSAKNRTVTADGREHPFSKCLIASGASAYVPPISGCDLDCVYTMRTVADAERVKRALEARPRGALVVGASMVGIKLVEMLRSAGAEVCLADMAEHIFPLSASPGCAAIIHGRLREQGVRLRFSAAIEGIEAAGGGARVRFGDGGGPERADMVLMCIGARPNTSFIDPEEIDMRQGVLVDNRMRASADGIYAAGDAAQGCNLLTGERQIIGLWANARMQGRAAGANMAGVPLEYDGETPHNIAHFMGMDFVGLGDVTHSDDVEIWDDGRRYASLHYRRGGLVGANLIDMPAESGVVRHILTKGLLLPPRPRRTGPLQEYLFEAVRSGGGFA